MVARRPATPPWLRPLGRWNPSAGSRCGPGGPSGAISPKFTPCTGAQSRGTNRLIQTVLICSFFLFFFYVPFRCSVNPWFQSSDDCVARHSTFWFKHPCMQSLWPPMTGFEKQGQRCKLRGRRQQVRACGEDLPQNQANAQGSPGKNLRHALG